MIRFGNILHALLCISAVCAIGSCGRGTSLDLSGEPIAFYVKTQLPVPTKGTVESTDDLLQKGLPIYVTDESESAPVFSQTEISYRQNGVWQSDVEWKDGKNYNFFAYITSPGNGTVSITQNGKIVTVTQPASYSQNSDVWSDYLLSYRVGANGTDAPLVKLDLERITTGIELYMTKSSNMTSVKLLEASFRNINTSATFNLTYHATPTDLPAQNGMKNIWSVKVNDNIRRTYSYMPSGGLELNTYDAERGRFAQENMVMHFLTVQQSIADDENANLYIRYQVDENDTLSDYEAEFNLSLYDIKAWTRGHKVRYYISIDTSVELEGTVDEWKSVDFIEGTLLPE